ncbi:MAG TPA: ribulose-phosphate 3-epimerase [Candidatus Krumholzibacteria bacterium]|nr:ribulose-phosphate 3-epimerase [Candidatus Krumholzibacteria bacterium]
MSWSHLVHSTHAKSALTAVAPSLLACDFSRLEEEIGAVEKAGVEFLHLDVMDGHFVNNITFGPVLVKAIDKLATVPLDTHLMIENPDHYIGPFLDAGADILTIHVEASHDVRRDLRAIRARGKKAGLSLNPDTLLSDVEPYLEELDLLLVMSVVPGFGGQAFMDDVLPNVTKAAKLRDRLGLTFAIEIDGGVNPETASRAREAGADILVAGTAIFRTPDYAASIAAIRG